MLLDIVEVARQHTGLQLAVEFTKILPEFGLIDKILSITCDNATNNNVMVVKMGERLVKFQGNGSQVQCFAHVVNLVAKSVLAQFKLPKRKKNLSVVHDRAKERLGGDEDNLDNDGFEVRDEGDMAFVDDVNKVLADGDITVAAKLQVAHDLAGNLDKQQQCQRNEKACEEHVNNEQDNRWVDEQWDMDADKLKELTKEVMPIWYMLVKLCKISFAVKNLPTVIGPRWCEICQACQLKELEGAEHTNQRPYSMEFNIQLVYEVDGKEWKHAQQLWDLLFATLFFSERKTSRITSVVLAMDHFNEVLASAIISLKNSAGIHAAAHLGKQKLNRYHSKTDHLEIYCVAMVLYPQYKLEYFQMMKWEEQWVTTARNIVADVFKDYTEPEVEEVEPDKDILIVDNPQLHATKNPAPPNMFAEYIARAYLNAPPESLTYTNTDGKEKTMTPMEWWVRHRDTYPVLLRMALDYLSIPSTAVDVDVQTVRSVMCLQAWMLAGLLKDKEMLLWLQGPQDIEKEDKDDVAEGWDYIYRTFHNLA